MQFNHIDTHTMTYILNIETATHICSVSLSKNGETIDINESLEDKTHAELLTVFVEDILNKNNIKPTDLSAIAISEGPGSYTGLRIGVSAAKGMCYGLKIPLISIPTLLAMANGMKENTTDTDSLLSPMIDARRMEVYTAVYDQKLEVIEKVHAKVIEEDAFKELLDQNKINFFGNGSEKCKELIMHKNANFINQTYISSKYMSRLAYEKFLNNDFEDVAYFEPFYLKEFQALKSKKKLF